MKMPRRHRAIASLSALLLMTLFGVAVMAMTTLLHAESARTRSATQGAQLRQMLQKGSRYGVAAFFAHQLYDDPQNFFAGVLL